MNTRGALETESEGEEFVYLKDWEEKLAEQTDETQTKESDRRKQLSNTTPALKSKTHKQNVDGDSFKSTNARSYPTPDTFIAGNEREFPELDQVAEKVEKKMTQAYVELTKHPDEIKRGEFEEFAGNVDVEEISGESENIKGSGM